jgi:hypothetical protein
MIVYGGNLLKDVTFSDLWSYDFKNNSYVRRLLAVVFILATVRFSFLVGYITLPKSLLVQEKRRTTSQIMGELLSMEGNTTLRCHLAICGC